MRHLRAAITLVCLFALGCTSAPPSDVPAASPEQSFERYRGLLDARALSADTRLLTSDSRALFEARGPSSSAQAAEARAIDRADGEPRVVVSGDRAVVMFDDDPRVSPYFLRLGPDGWLVDLASMSRHIVFDGENRWRLRSTSHPYGFAFRAG